MPAHDADGFFNQVAPGVVLVLLVRPLFEAVVFEVIEATGVEVEAIGRSVVAELFAIDDSTGVARQQLAIGFVFVTGFAAQFVESAAQFADVSLPSRCSYLKCTCTLQGCGLC
ncbi:hypothetical protein ALP73_200003 [Pseudomonas coronafaciens pv. garcae]|uniref:Uncharacterized protein n=1 Tax=Pseudomonas coronafaciens pv. garcae TaxID=251653 RepID=A0AB37QWP9_9PSED|nr:hypothetical protein ALP73_200003 [Pseudomonas coronafaciens pv. garcae]RMS06382.1 hypothetical protein ALP74_200072 [Pseudomonas coronafaciens pv. garcae]